MAVTVPLLAVAHTQCVVNFGHAELLPVDIENHVNCVQSPCTACFALTSAGGAVTRSERLQLPWFPVSLYGCDDGAEIEFMDILQSNFERLLRCFAR